VKGKELQDAAVALARTKGYIAAHFSPARVRDSFITNYAYDSKGWPDLILVGRGRVIAVEVKGTGDSLSAEQTEWLARLSESGMKTLVLTPKGWRDGELEALLDG
jgi:hypothetical protein